MVPLALAPFDGVSNADPGLSGKNDNNQRVNFYYLLGEVYERLTLVKCHRTKNLGMHLNSSRYLAHLGLPKLARITQNMLFR